MHLVVYIIANRDDDRPCIGVRSKRAGIYCRQVYTAEQLYSGNGNMTELNVCLRLSHNIRSMHDGKIEGEIAGSWYTMNVIARQCGDPQSVYSDDCMQCSVYLRGVC